MKEWAISAKMPPLDIALCITFQKCFGLNKALANPASLT
jgi:hypothetical protein